MIDLAPPVERAFLVAVDTGQDAGWTAEESLTELAQLAATAGAEVVGAEWQNRRHVDPNWYVGKGKAEELKAAYRKRALETHPDHGGDEASFRRVLHAYEEARRRIERPRRGPRGRR